MLPIIIFLSIIFIFYIAYKLEPLCWRLVYAARKVKGEKLFNRQGKELFTRVNEHFFFDIEENTRGIFLKGSYCDREIIIRKLNEPGHDGIEIVFSVELDLSRSAVLCKRIPLRRILGGVGRFPEQTGDDSFDGRVIIKQHDPLFLTALLSKSNRLKLKRLFGASEKLVFNSKEVILHLGIQAAFRAGRLKRYLNGLSSVIDSIEKKDMKIMLITNLKKERKAKLKINILNELGKNYRTEEDVIELMRRHTTFKNKGIQINAWRFLGEEGCQHLLSILKPKLYVDYKIEIVKSFCFNQYRPAKEAMISMFKRSKSADLKVEILKTLDELNDQDYSAFLLKEFKYKRNSIPQVKLTMAEQLIKRNNREMMPALREYISDFELHREELSKDVQESIARIQVKLDEARGMLSAPEISDAEGALSLSGKSYEGALSLDESDPEKKSPGGMK